jgi:hypothetical protein
MYPNWKSASANRGFCGTAIFAPPIEEKEKLSQKQFGI